MASDRIPVYFVQMGHTWVPLSLGMLHAYLRVHDGGALRERLDCRLLISPTREEIAQAQPGIWLFADYIWSFGFNMEVSRTVKACDARHLTVHGGPSSPKYVEACDRFLHDQPHVDVAVRGEGELTTAELIQQLVRAADRRQSWRDGLEEVAGVSYLAEPGGRMVRTRDRERIQDLDILPSPYSDGTFDAWHHDRMRAAVLESNRGCPYGCTFCDWGSATQQKIHKFDLERVMRDIEWIARHNIVVVFSADANFGTFDRDVEIAEYLGKMRRDLGHPREFVVSYAKNGNDRIPRIVRAMVTSGVVTEGVISIQSRDPETLRALRRSNIKTSNYEKLVAAYRAEGLPVTTDLMIGLPGSTLRSHKADIQWCIDEDLVGRFFRTVVLPNSPMSDPAYMREHNIQVRDGLVVSTATASEEELRRTWDIVLMYEICEKSTLLRYIMRHLQWRYGLQASDLLHSIAHAVRVHPERFPEYLRGIEREKCLSGVMEDPAPFYAAIWRHCCETLGLALGSDEDRTVWALNAAVVPRRGIAYPIQVESPWDVLGYFQRCVSPAAGETRRLERSDPPQRFLISDPDGYAQMASDQLLVLINNLRLFELDWPVKQRFMVPAPGPRATLTGRAAAVSGPVIPA
jgi:radical SAM superfamily enzyme YgiQ (UPF0313 family)